MTGVRVTDEAVAAALKAAGWDWPTRDDDGVPLPTPADAMRPILEAAAPLLVDDRAAAALELHVNDHGLCSHCDGLARSAMLPGRVPWPCRTALALGAAS
jgi:hypothetical protein